MGVFGLVDESVITTDKLIECGYVFMSGSKFYLKPIFHHSELGPHSLVGVQKSFIRVREYPEWMFGEKIFYVDLQYILTNGENRTIQYPHITTVSELCAVEMWGRETTLTINKDRIEGTFNWPKYEIKSGSF